jgi:hypothetical protein
VSPMAMAQTACDMGPSPYSAACALSCTELGP